MIETAVTLLKRFTAANPCPVCGGHPSLPRGQGVRCAGFRTDDGYLHCTREEHGGSLKASGAAVPTFAHIDRDDCHCGHAHARYGALPAESRRAGSRRDATRLPTIVKTYDYTDDAGALVYQTIRYAPKDFKQRRPNGRGGWVWNLDGVQRVPYHLPQLLAADPARAIFVVEGEKDADRLASIGLIATTNAGGAGKWTDVLSEHLRGHERVVVLPHFDQAGHSHGQVAARSLRCVVADVRVVNLPGLPERGDISDWLDAGHTIEDLRGLVKLALPVEVQTDRLASVKYNGAITVEHDSPGGYRALRSFDDDVVATMLGELGRLASMRDQLDRSVLRALTTLADCCGSSKAAVRDALAAALAGQVM